MNEPKYIPDHELRKAYDQGSEDAKNGKKNDSCPFYLPALQAQWIAGYEAMTKWLSKASNQSN